MDSHGGTASISHDAKDPFDKAQDFPSRTAHPSNSLSTHISRQRAWAGPASVEHANHLPIQARSMELLSILNPISSEGFEKLKQEHDRDVVTEAKSQDLQGYKVRKNYRPKGKRHNKAYTPEQVHYIMYHREDLELPWIEVRDRYRKRYNTTDCFEGALQSRHYRAQLVPLLDNKASPVHDANGAVIMRKMTVRERNHKIWTVPILDVKHRLVTIEKGKISLRELTKDEREGPMGARLKTTLDKYIKLGDRLPGLLSKYKDWVTSEDQIEGERKEKYRSDHGIVLPGAMQCGGEFRDTIVAVNAAGVILNEEFRKACITSSSVLLESLPNL